MAHFKRPLWQNLRLRLVAWYSLLTGLTMLAFDCYLYFQFRQSLLEQVDRTLEVATIQALKNLDDEVSVLTFDPRQNAPALASLLGEAGVSVYLFNQEEDLQGSFGDLLPNPTQAELMPGWQTWRTGNKVWRVYTEAIPARDQRPAGWLRVAHSLEAVDQVSTSLLQKMLVGVPLILTMGGMGGLFLASRALNPIDKITRMAERVRVSGDLSQRLRYRGVADELERLATMFDDMLDSLQATFQRERRFIADASHELRTPLTAIKGRLSVTMNQPRSAERYLETLEAVDQEVDWLIRLSSDLLLLSQLEQHHVNSWTPESLNFSDLLEAIGDQVQPLADLKAVGFVTAIPPELNLQGSPDHLIRLFFNLLDNAIKHTPPGGEVCLTACAEGRSILVTVADTGPGITSQHIPHLFERFYRTEASRTRQVGGTGLGLAIAQEIAHRHGGTIAVVSTLKQGAAFTVTLPRCE